MAPLIEPKYWAPVGTKTPQFGGSAHADEEKINTKTKHIIIFQNLIGYPPPISGETI
jgi:hypothetical protein